jgi:hypothetical protein
VLKLAAGSDCHIRDTHMRVTLNSDFDIWLLG